MNSRILFSSLLAAVMLVSGCETMSREDQGALIGGVLGGVAGAQVGDGSGRTAAIILGTLAGSVIGRQIGQSMDDTDRMRAARALSDNPTGQSTVWTNPDTGRRYVVTPTRTYETGGTPCREFTLASGAQGVPAGEASGTACLRGDGAWELT